MNVLRKASLNPSAGMKRSSSAQSAATSTSAASQVISPAELDKQLTLGSPPAMPNSRRELEDLSQRPGESPLATTAFDQPGSPQPQAAAVAVDSPEDASSSSSSSSEYASIIEQSQDTSAEASPSSQPPPITSLAVPSTLHLTAANVPSSEADLLKDLELVKEVLDLFLNSRMRDAQDLCYEPAKKGSLYLSHGYSCITTMQALLTFEHQDLAYAIECCHSTMHLCSVLRKPAAVQHLVSNWLRGSASSDQMSGMTTVQRHAELVYAECIILKAFASIMRSGDFLTLVREALALRASHSIYKALGRYCDAAKAAGQPADADFESGVKVGLGAISLIFSLLPEKVVGVMSLFGFAGDKNAGLALLKSPGGWGDASGKPVPRSSQGLRRPLADMTLLAYILYISSLVPVGSVDTKLATEVIAFNQDIYPNGAFFWLFRGRLKLVQTMCEEASGYYWRSIKSQQEAIQLHNCCHWDLALVSLALQDYKAAQQSLETVLATSNWSKAMWSYGVATTLYDQLEKGTVTGDNERERVANLMRSVPDMRQKIGGKSIPIEKYVARRAKRFVDQGNKLLLPSLEFCFMLNALAFSPTYVLEERHLPRIEEEYKRLQSVAEEDVEGFNGNGSYYDDLCLCQLLSGSSHRLIAYPEEHVVPQYGDRGAPDKKAHVDAALECLKDVIKKGLLIKFEHHLVWFGHYELGLLYSSMGQREEAARHFNTVLNPKSIEVQPSEGKVSLQQAVMIRANAALDRLKEPQES